MLSLQQWLIFAFAALLLVLTPGPNMVYLISRSICQGKKAGVISLSGVVLGFLVHMVSATIGLTALFMAIPMAYDLLRWIGALYLAWLAWQAVKPGARSPFETRQLKADAPKKLFAMGFLTSALNPKVALFYLSLLPQFVDAHNGSMLVQSLLLGGTQISISFTINFIIVLSAAHIANWFAHNPTWLKVQRYLMGGVLGGLALRLALEKHR